MKQVIPVTTMRGHERKMVEEQDSYIKAHRCSFGQVRGAGLDLIGDPLEDLP